MLQSSMQLPPTIKLIVMDPTMMDGARRVLHLQLMLLIIRGRASE